MWLFARAGGGAQAVGTFSTVLAFATPLFVVCQLGLRTILVSESVRWPLRTYYRIRTIGNVAAAAIMMAFVLLHPAIPIALGLAITVMKLTDSVLDLELAVVQYHGRLRQLGLMMLVSALGGAIAASVVMALTESGVACVSAVALVSLFTSVWARFASRGRKYVPTGTHSGLLPILKASLAVTSSQLLSSVLMQLPILMLASSGNATTVGIYAAAAYLLTAAGLIGASMQTLLITPFRSLRQVKGDREVVARAFKATRTVLTVALVPAIAVIVWGSPILKLVYGRGFAVDSLSLLLLAGAAIFTLAAYVLSVALNVLNGYFKVTSSLAISVMIALAAGLILLQTPVPLLQTGMAISAIGAASRMFTLCLMLRPRKARRTLPDQMPGTGHHAQGLV